MDLLILFNTIVFLSFMGSIVAGIIILVKQLFKNKLSAKWHYYIWVLLIARLIIPYAPQSNFSIFNIFSNISSLQVSSINNTVFDLGRYKNSYSMNKETTSKDKAIEKNINQNSIENTVVIEKEITDETQVNKNIESGKKFNYTYLGIIWAAGILVILLYVIAVNVKFHRTINKFHKCENDEINKLLDQCKLQMNISRKIPIIINKRNKAPYLLGLFRPKIIIASQTIDKFSLEEVRYIFLHELSHFKRKDILVNWIIILVQAMHWFNPIVWYAFHKMRQDCEISCDEMVLNYLKPNESKSYGQTILNLTKAFSNKNLTPGVAGIVNKSETKRRILMISRFSKKSKRWSIAAIGITLIIGAVSLTSSNEQVKAYLGFNNQKQSNSDEILNKNTTLKTEDSNLDKQKAIMDKLEDLISKNASTDEVTKFVDENISKLSKENASIMLSKLEDYQKKNLDKFGEKVYGEDIQIGIRKIYKSDFDINKIDNIQDKKLKDLLIETRNSGYKIETGEGMYYPVLNYEAYKKYSTYVTEDLKDYIEIMAVESNKTPAEDGGLKISWDELLKRALKQEEFINKYNSSIKINDMKQLYSKYTSFVLYGLNNTPLFSYNTKVMVPEAKESYAKVVKSNSNSTLVSNIKGLLGILEKNNYKLTNEVESYRKNIVK